MNKTHNKSYLGKKVSYYGWDGHSFIYSAKGLIKNNAEILTLEEWENIVNNPNLLQREDNKFNTEEDIYLDKSVTFNSPEELIYKFIATLNNRSNTNGLETYYKNGMVQTNIGKLRSFDDIYITTRTYYPNIKIKEVLEILLRLNVVINGTQFYPQLASCGSMGRIRFVYYFSLIEHTDIKRINKYNSKYSWEELLSMLNLHSPICLNKYIKNLEKIIIGNEATYVYNKRRSST